MNEHVEILVEVKPNALMNFLKLILWGVCAISVVSMFLGMFGMIVPFIVAAAAGVGAYFIGLRVNIEYEYTLTDKELDIDVIFSKEKRKHIITYDLSKLEIMAPVKSHELDSYRNRQVDIKDYTSRYGENERLQYLMYIDGQMAASFEPDEQLITAIKNIAPRKVFTY